MPSSLFPQPSQMPNLLNLLKSRNPQQLFNELMNTNPTFSKFVTENRNKSMEQIVADYNLDISKVKTFLQDVT